MPRPRKLILPAGEVTWVHAIQRCVRRAYLCGNGREHRRGWVEAQLALVARCCAVEVAAYAVMTNHLHVVLRMRPDVAATWDAVTVAERWCALFGTRLPKGADGQVEPAVIQQKASDAGWVAERRTRLADLGWCMRAVAEPIARRANREDDCTGRFWEGRFRSIPLLDQAALTACMAYVDLNPVRAKMCDRPERAAFTGVRARIRARQRHRTATRITQRVAEGPARSAALAAVGVAAMPRSIETGLWLAPVAACVVGDLTAGDSSPGLSAEDYLLLVDATGRWLRAGKRGAIPPELAPILARLDLEVEDWIGTMCGWRQMLGSAVGGATSRAALAAARGLRWVQNRCRLFAA